MVPHSTDVRQKILKDFHCSCFSMHSSGKKMYHDFRPQYYWSWMKKHVVYCLTCQQVKAEHQRPAGLLQPIVVAKWKWEHVTMDFVTNLQ